MIRNRIAFRRIHEGITQVELAEKMHVSPSTLSDIERNIRQPNVEQIWALCHIFACDFYELFTDD